MSVANPANLIPRRSIVGDENEYVKMFDPPTVAPATPELMAATNPVPEFMASVVPGFRPPAANTVHRRLLAGLNLTSWDGLHTFGLFTLSEQTNPLASGGSFPGPTIRVPRGVIFHGQTDIGGPPHTIHWHGIEPTPINDGVGHCSMEIGSYTYQWQPNFIGSYFYHCHRNTVQHFDFGLYGFLIVEPPDAYDPSDGKNVGGYPRRTAANTANFPQFPGFNGSPLESMDPHAFTVPYDVEALWVVDDIDSNWHALAPGRFATFPQSGAIPGVNDDFHGNIANGFFAFNDFNPDYFFCTGVPFAGPAPGPVRLQSNVVVPAALNSGVAGMQVDVNARVNQTILVRCLDAAYCPVRVTFPIDVVIIAWDGRALGVPPWARYNHAFLVPANTPIELSTARRIGALMRSATPFTGVAKVEFFSHLRTDPTVGGHVKLFEGHIPIVIS